MHHPNKRVRRTKAPSWDGSEIGGTRVPQLTKTIGAGCPQTTGSEEPPADYGKRLLARQSRLRATTTVMQKVRRTQKEGLSCCSRWQEEHWTIGAAEQAKRSRRAAAQTTGWWNKRANADLQK